MIARRLIDSLYVEAMLLADEARAYFDDEAHRSRSEMSAIERVLFSCESLKVTTRLMHVIAWLLTQRAIEAGELPASVSGDPGRRLGDAVDSDAGTLARLPVEARLLIGSSIELFDRVARLEAKGAGIQLAGSPALTLMRRLEQAF